MRKLVLIIAAIALVSVSANSQETFHKGTQLLKATVGFNSNGIPLSVAYEKGIADNMFGVQKLNLGVGAYLGFFGYSNTKPSGFGSDVKTSFVVIAPGVSGSLHYQFIPKLDTYVGLSLGGSISRSSASNSMSSASATTATKVAVAWGLALGARYEITPKWGAFIEAGHGTGNFTLGAAYKF